MDFRELAKNKNFIIGLVAGLILTFCSSYIPPVGALVEFIFDNISSISPLSEWGIWGNIIHSYLLSTIVYLFFYFLINKKLLFLDWFKFFLGLVVSYLLFFVIALLAISQFRFTQ